MDQEATGLKPVPEAENRFDASRSVDLSGLPADQRTVSAAKFTSWLWRRSRDTQTRAIRAAGAHVVGPVDLRGLTLTASLALVGCQFDAALVFDDASLGGLQLIDTTAPLVRMHGAKVTAGVTLERTAVSLDADRLTLEGDLVMVSMSADTRTDGRLLSLRDARVSGSVRVQNVGPTARAIDFTGAVVDRSVAVDALTVESGGPAIVAINARVSGDLLISSSHLRGTVDLTRIVVGRRLLVTDTEIRGDAHALLLDGAEIAQDTSLQSCQVTGQVRLLAGRIGGQLNTRRCTFEATSGTAISATGLIVESGVAFVDGTTVRGELRCDRLRAGSGLALPGARLVNPGGDALVLSQAQIDGSLHLIDGCQVEGTILMIGGQVNGQVSLRGAVVGSPGPSGGAVVLDGVEIRGSLLASGGMTVDGGFFLRGASVGFGSDTGATATTHSVEFRECRIKGDLDMARTRVFGHCDFTGAVIDKEVYLLRCELRDALTFSRTSISGNVSMRGAVFDGPAELRLELIDRTLDLQQIRVVRPLRIAASAGRIELRGASLEAETSIEVTGALDASALRVRAPSRIRQKPGSSSSALWLAGLRDASMDAVLTIGADVDGRACEFLGAQNLDRVVIDSTVVFARFRGRRALYEEIRLREADPTIGPDADAAQAPDLAAIYRGLRKGLEDRKDAPGAADFYYGEMEMRRLSRGRPSERWLLTLYWLVAGYGLRAWRAFAAVLLVIAVTSVAMASWGFDRTVDETITRSQEIDSATGEPIGSPEITRVRSQGGSPPNMVDATLFTLQSALPFAPLPAVRPLTTFGTAARIIVRFVTPLLLGLGALALRSRIKR